MSSRQSRHCRRQLRVVLDRLRETLSKLRHQYTTGRSSRPEAADFMGRVIFIKGFP
jgi:hypothetical protein